MRTSFLKTGLMFTALSLAFTSCSSDDDNTPSKPEAVTTTVTYSIPNSYDMLKVADMKVYYTNNDGTEISETITTPSWEKVLTKVRTPGTYQLRVVYTRNNKPLEQESYFLGTKLTLSYVKGNGVSSASKTFGSTTTLSKDRIEPQFANPSEVKGSIEITE